MLKITWALKKKHCLALSRSPCFCFTCQEFGVCSVVQLTHTFNANAKLKLPALIEHVVISSCSGWNTWYRTFKFFSLFIFLFSAVLCWSLNSWSVYLRNVLLSPDSSYLQQQMCLRVKERMKMGCRAARTGSHNQVMEMSSSLAQTCWQQQVSLHELWTLFVCRGYTETKEAAD